jgi:hypothetical protein
MDPLTDKEIELLLTEEARQVRLPNGTVMEVAATRQHWLVLSECLGYGWSVEEVSRLALLEGEETGRGFEECFRYVLAYIQADGRHTLGTPKNVHSTVPLLPNNYQPRNLPCGD